MISPVWPTLIPNKCRSRGANISSISVASSSEAAAVPGPHLRTDVVDDLGFIRRSPGGAGQRTGESQIESGIIDQHNRVRLTRLNFVQSLVKLSSKVAVMFDHFPQPEDAGFVDPILKARTRDRFHLRSAATDEAKINPVVTQCAHQRCSVIVRARLPCY